MFRYFCGRFTNARAPDRELQAEFSSRAFPPFAAFAVYDHQAQITRTLSNSQYNFQSRETEAQTAPNQAWEMRSGMYCRGMFRMIEPPTIPPGALQSINMDVEVSWSPAFLNARANLPPNFILLSVRPRRGGNWVESRAPPPPFIWAAHPVPRNVPQQDNDDTNHEEDRGEGVGEERVNEVEVEEEREEEEQRREEEEEVVVVEDDSHEEEVEESEGQRSEASGDYYGRPENDAEEEYREEYVDEEGEEEVTVVEEITEEQIFGNHFRPRNIPFTVFGADGVIANPENFILVESDESPAINNGSASEPESGRVLTRITRIEGD